MVRIVDKVSLERLKDRELRVSFLCPYCKSTRITLAGMNCPKCQTRTLLDIVSLVLIKERTSPATR